MYLAGVAAAGVAAVGLAFRMGGDELLVLLRATSADEADRILERLPEALARFNATAARAVRFSPTEAGRP